MAGVSFVTVGEEDGEARLDRWFKRHYPQVTQGQLQKLLRTKQVKVDGKKAATCDAGAGDPRAAPAGQRVADGAGENPPRQRCRFGS